MAVGIRLELVTPAGDFVVGSDQRPDSVVGAGSRVADSLPTTNEELR